MSSQEPIDYTPSSKNDINSVKRLPDRGAYDSKTVFEILDDGLVAHVGFNEPDTGDDWPVVIPMIYGRDGDEIFLHGHLNSRLLKSLEKGIKCCITVTHVDALIVALTPFSNSMNYRSCVLFGQATLIPDSDSAQKNHALTLITDHPFRKTPSRWSDSRPPTQNEIISTRVVSFKIDYASAKIRTGDPHDKDHDIEKKLPFWSGRVERKKGWEKVVRSPYCGEDIEVPGYIKDMLQSDG